MQSYVQAQKSMSEHAELMGRKRQEEALRDFKDVLRNLLHMLREASGAETAYMYWINRERSQFVMETKSTSSTDVIFQDRVSFKDHFLDHYKAIQESVILAVGSDIGEQAFSHHYHSVSVSHVTLLPFINNDETVAITVLEGNEGAIGDLQSEVLYAYSNALGKVLNTYLEMNDLYEDQQEWVQYESCLSFLDKPGRTPSLIYNMLQAMQGFLHEGGATFLCRGMGIWAGMLNANGAVQPPPLGMPVEKRSVSWEALEKGAPEFSIHFNNNPKRVSPRELYTKGATFAIPLMLNDRRKGLVLVYDNDPLTFKESTKHKLTNLVRVTVLKMQAQMRHDEDEPLFANQYDAVIPDLWEQTVNSEIKRLQENRSPYKTWVALLSLSELSKIRTELRMEELNLMQKDLVQAINPNQFGVPGIVGFHTDYIYRVVLQSRDPEAIRHWSDRVQEKFEKPFMLSSNREIETGLRIGYVELNAESEDSYQVLMKAKAALSAAVKRHG